MVGLGWIFGSRVRVLERESGPENFFALNYLEKPLIGLNYLEYFSGVATRSFRHGGPTAIRDYVKEPATCQGTVADIMASTGETIAVATGGRSRGNPTWREPVTGHFPRISLW